MPSLGETVAVERSGVPWLWRRRSAVIGVEGGCSGRHGRCCRWAVGAGWCRVWALAVSAAVLAGACLGGGGDSPGAVSHEGADEGALPVEPIADGDGPRASTDEYEIGVGRTVPPEGVFVDVAASTARTCGVREGGELVCWGHPWRFDGREVLPSGRFVKVSLGGVPHDGAGGGGEYGCAIGADGSLACWSDQSLSDAPATAGRASSLARVPQGRFVDVSAQALCAVRVDGRLVCWGDNERNRIELPRGRFSEIAQGSGLSSGRLCALGADGGLSCWGDRANFGRSRMPAGRFADLAMTSSVGCAVRAEGSLVCWHHADLPDVGLRVLELVGERQGSFREVTMGAEHVCALAVGGALECWGHNESALAQSRPGPFAQIATSAFAYCASDPAGRVSCWGSRLDEGDVGEWDTPEGVFTQMSVSEGLACGVRGDTTVQCWGDIFEYHEAVRRRQAELEEELASRDPERVDRAMEAWDSRRSSEPDWVHGRGLGWEWDLPPEGDGYASVHLVGRNACGLRVDGSVWCLRADEDAQADLAAAGRYLSIEGTDYRLCGIRAGGGYGCVDAEADAALPHRDFATTALDEKCGLRTDGTPEGWGFRDPVPPPPDIEPLISAAGFDAQVMCAVNAEGTLACWYDDPDPPHSGHFDLDDWTAGDSTVRESSPAVRPSTAGGPFAQVASGYDQYDGGLCALDTAGEVSCWWRSGSNEAELPSGQPPVGPFADVAVGTRHACAIRTDGTIACWGEDFDSFYEDIMPSGP